MMICSVAAKSPPSARVNAGLFLPLALVVLLAFTGAATADTVSGRFCAVAETRINNPSLEKVLKEKIWEYSEPQSPVSPVLGWLDVACADRGPSRAPVQDFGRRIWFNISGPQNAPAEAATMTLGDVQQTSKVGNVGINVQGLSIYGVISPQHDCAFTVSVWAETCQNR